MFATKSVIDILLSIVRFILSDQADGFTEKIEPWLYQNILRFKWNLQPSSNIFYQNLRKTGLPNKSGAINMLKIDCLVLSIEAFLVSKHEYEHD